MLLNELLKNEVIRKSVLIEFGFGHANPAEVLEYVKKNFNDKYQKIKSELKSKQRNVLDFMPKETELMSRTERDAILDRVEEKPKSVSANMKDWQECRDWRLFTGVSLEDISSETNWHLDILEKFEAGLLENAAYYDAIRAAYYHYMAMYSESLENEHEIMQEFIESQGLMEVYENFYEQRVAELYEQYDI